MWQQKCLYGTKRERFRENTGGNERAEESVLHHIARWKEQMEKDGGEISEAIEQEAAFFPVQNQMEGLEYVLVIQGSVEDIKVIGRLCVSQIRNLITAYRERMDKNNFLQNLLLDNFLLVDIYNKAKKLGIAIEARRVASRSSLRKKETALSWRQCADFMRRVQKTLLRQWMRDISFSSSILK